MTNKEQNHPRNILSAAVFLYGWRVMLSLEKVEAVL